ncbi:craniofacial development protein 2-like [Sitophilus oryzae]|uniref:Craniofacial development protein 2-like n=1 Tax=Sitophilus oryzae TaxID=7048 RepID=A0A6J2YC04_SITOR|nr:craniofacial development protein 2-like [Sitophilus oryzae]
MDSGGDKLVTSKTTRKRKCSRVFKIATYNVRSLSTEEKLLELQEVLDKVNWDFIGMSEIRRQGEAWTTLKSGHILYHIDETDNSIGGVGFLINKKHASDILSIASVSKRVAYVIFRLNSRLKMKIIQAYAPTCTAEEDEIDQFYEDIDRAITVPGCIHPFL